MTTTGKKGILDLFFIIIILFGVGIAIVVFYMIIHAVKTDIEPKLDNPTSTQVLTDTQNTVLNMDYTFVIAFVMLMIFVIVSLAFIRSHPIFFAVSLILLVILILVAAILSNSFEEISNQPGAFNESVEQYTMVPYYMGKLPLIALITATLGFIVLFAKPWDRSGGL